jgi:hypothetical protein
MSSEPTVEQPAEPTEQPAEPPKPAPKRDRHRTLRRLVALGAVLALVGAVVGFLAQRSALSPDDSPEKTYQKIFDAYGGQEALDRWKCGVVKYESTDDLPGESHCERTHTETFWLPGKTRLDVREIVDSQTKRWTIASKGRVEWRANEAGLLGVDPAPSIGWELYASYIHFFHPHYLLSKGEKIGAKGIEYRPDGGRDLVISVDDSSLGSGECRVDQRTKLLQNYRGTVKSQDGDLSTARFEYSDYRNTDGGPVPGRITMYLGDRKVREIRFVSVEFRAVFGPAEFDPPEPQQP